jgi:hypothetical protein
MPGQRCSECGASYEIQGDSCDARFNNLLALDHSRQEPWGSRHGIAFAVFALQHPGRFPEDTLNRTWQILHRVYVSGDEPARVIGASKRAQSVPLAWNVPPVPAIPSGSPAITIADLGEFEAAKYAGLLDAWARATMTWWGVNLDTPQLR